MLILLVLLIFFAALGIPLAFAIGASCVTYILIYAPTFITMLPQRVWNGAYSELMIAMPLFMLAGELMNTGGITQRIINFCMELLRPIRGGLGEVNIVASMIFGGISGSSVADTSALGSILIPAMEKEGYPPACSSSWRSVTMAPMEKLPSVSSMVSSSRPDRSMAVPTLMFSILSQIMPPSTRLAFFWFSCHASSRLSACLYSRIVIIDAGSSLFFSLFFYFNTDFDIILL